MGEKRDEYVEKFKKSIDGWNDDIDKLEAQAGKAKADVRAQLDKQIAELKTKRQDLQRKMSEMHKASEGAWEDVKAGADIALKALGEAVSSAKSRFSK